MLVRLAIENFLCFGRRAELNLRAPFAGAATKDQEPPGPSASFRQLPDGSRVPRLVLVAGPNGSGKSAVQRALVLLRTLVLAGSRPGKPLPVTPCKLLPAAPTSFELEVYTDGTLYNYALSVTREGVVAERLETNRGGVPELLFSRTGTSITLGEVTAEERARLDLLIYGTRPEQPFLAEAVRRKAEFAAPLASWLRESLQLIRPEAKVVGLAARAAHDPEYATFLGEQLDLALSGDSGRRVTATSVVRESVPLDAFGSEDEQKEVLAALTGYADGFVQTPEGEVIAEQDGRFVELYRVALRFQLESPQGQQAELELGELHDGALRLLHLSPILYGVQRPGQGRAPAVYVVDEFLRSFHPELGADVLRRYQLGDDGGQLLVMAFDTALRGPAGLTGEQLFELTPTPSGPIFRREQPAAAPLPN